MKIIIAPDSFKGSLTAVKVADYIEKGILKVYTNADIVKFPMADGGEGTVHTLVDAVGGEIIYEVVCDPLGRPINSYYGILGNGQKAVIEMAAASGLTLIHKDERNPLKTTTYGTGELIKSALDRGVSEIIIGIGGSATNDAGVGMAQALGVSFKDENEEEVGFGGENLNRIKSIDLSRLDERIKDTKISVACDVNNRFYGVKGAAYVYAEQKGASKKQIKLLNQNMIYFAELIKQKMGIELQDIIGGGSAGGLGAGIVTFLNGELSSGIKLILSVYDFKEELYDADLVITGEGKIDKQTMNGKVPIGVAKVAKKYNIPVIAIAGTVDEKNGQVLNDYFDSVISISQAPVSLEEAFINTGRWIEFTIEQIMRLIQY